MRVGRLFHVVEGALLTLFIFTKATFTARSCSRAVGIAIITSGISANGMVDRVRGRASCLFICGIGRIGLGHGIGIGTRGGSMTRILGGIFRNASVCCTVRNGGVVLVDGTGSKRTIRRTGGMANVIGSTGNRPMVNTGMVIGNRSVNAVASVSKQFILSTPGSTILRVACVNFASRSIGVKGGGRVIIALARSARALSRIIMINCNARGGIGLANTMKGISVGSVKSQPVAGTNGTLRNAISKMCTLRGSNRPKTSNTIVGVHNINALGGDSPLILVSNFPKDVSSISTSSVDSVSMLGSTTSTSVCNGHTTGNMILMAAGGKTLKGIGLSCGNCFNVRRTASLPDILGSCSCTALCGRTYHGSNRRRGCLPRRVRGFESKASPVCPDVSCFSICCSGTDVRGRHLGLANNSSGFRCTVVLNCLRRRNVLMKAGCQGASFEAGVSSCL